MQIRRAVAEDTPTIVRLVGAFISSTQYRGFVKFVPEQLVLVVDLLLEHGVIFLAERDGEALGFIAAWKQPDPYTAELIGEELAWFVDPGARGMARVGYKLLGCLEDWARQEGLAVLKMVAPADSPRVGLYYTRHGYEPVETAYLKRF